jgi:aminopeptidase
MKDPRTTELAKVLTSYSVNVQKGDHVYIDVVDTPDEMTNELIKAISDLGGHVYVKTSSSRVLRTHRMNMTKEQLEISSEHDLELMKKMDAFIAISGNYNSSEDSDIPPKQMGMIKSIRRPVINERVNNTKWCILRWPTPSMADSAGMSTEAFEDFYFKVCTFDYSKMKKAATALVKRMEQTDIVQIEGPNDTNVTFSIKDIPVIPCVGEFNVPDGEVFTAPVKDSMNGVIHYNTPTIYNGIKFEDVRLVIKDGKIIEATSSDNDALNIILDSDEGARFFGEFAIGFNPYITKAMCDILFDEKIAGSIHLTPGKCYDDASNGNTSTIHWDMVLIQTKEHYTPDTTRSTISFDGEIIREDGLFIVDDLKCLNPDELLKEKVEYTLNQIAKMAKRIANEYDNIPCSSTSIDDACELFGNDNRALIEQAFRYYPGYSYSDMNTIVDDLVDN